jgi:hypothetical protein
MQIINPKSIPQYVISFLQVFGAEAIEYSKKHANKMKMAQVCIQYLQFIATTHGKCEEKVYMHCIPAVLNLYLGIVINSSQLAGLLESVCLCLMKIGDSLVNASLKQIMHAYAAKIRTLLNS